MYRFLLVFLFLFSGAYSYAQTLIIVGSDTGLPVKGVSVSNKDKSIVVYSDNSGLVNLDSFNKKAPIFIYHYLYLKKKSFISNLTQNNNTITLEKITERLKEVVLSVTRGKEKRNRVAEQIEVFTEKEIKRISPQTTADLLATSPGIKVQKSQFGGGSPVLRGMEANRVLLVVDGVRMNNAIYRKGHLQNSITVSPSVLERVEVLFGPSSVIYGSDALGGVIHYYTKMLKTSESKEVKSSLFSRVSSVNNEITTQFDTELSFRKWASYTSLSYSSFGDLKMGKNRSHGFEDWGKVFEYSNNSDKTHNEDPLVNSDPNLQRNTGYSQKDFLQKVYLPVSNDTELLFNFQYSESSDVPRFDKLTERKKGKLKFGEWFYGPQKRLLFSTQLQLDEVHNWIDKGTVTIAYQDIYESRIQRKFGSLERLYRNENVNVISLNGDFSVSLAKKKNKKLSYGFEVVYNKVNSHSNGDLLIANSSNNRVTGVESNFTVQSRYPDGGSDYLTQAMYIGYRQDYDEKHTLNAGIRFTNTQLNASWVDQSFVKLPDSIISVKNSAVTATIGHIYKPTKSTKISAVLSSGFRSPNIDDIGKIREKSGIVTVPNLDLKPEYVYNSEIGFLQHFNDRLFSVGVNLYYTLIHNYIIRAPFQVDGESTITYDGEEGLPIVANLNKGNAYVKGGTVSFQGEINENWYAKGALTFTKGEAYDTGDPLSSIPPLFGNLLVGYKRDKLEVNVGYEYNAAKKPKDYNLDEGIDNIQQTPVINEESDNALEKYAGTPSWEVFNVSTSYELFRNIDFQFQVDNVFDTHYKEFASGISAPGRNFSASVRYLF